MSTNSDSEKMKQETVAKQNVSDGFESSDDEGCAFDLSPLKTDWLDLAPFGCDGCLGISPLPGCRFKDTWRSLDTDIKQLISEDIKEVFCLCSKGELNKYRVPKLLSDLQAADIDVHHTPFPDGMVPSISDLIKMIDDIHVSVMNKRKTVIHCFGGLGRSCFVAAALMMKLDDSLSPDKAIEILRELRGPGAVQSVKQFNFLHDLRDKIAAHNEEVEDFNRSLSR